MDVTLYKGDIGFTIHVSKRLYVFIKRNTWNGRLFAYKSLPIGGHWILYWYWCKDVYRQN